MFEVSQDFSSCVLFFGFFLLEGWVEFSQKFGLSLFVGTGEIMVLLDLIILFSKDTLSISKT